MICPECGSPVADADAFCPFCGIRLESDDGAAAPVDESMQSTIMISQAEAEELVKISSGSVNMEPSEEEPESHAEPLPAELSGPSDIDQPEHEKSPVQMADRTAQRGRGKKSPEVLQPHYIQRP